MTLLNLASVRLQTHSEGPGERIAVWFQGCKRSCPGCCNPEMQPFTACHIVPLDALTARFDRQIEEHPEIEGLTLVGGEPLLQPAGAAGLARWAQSRGKTVLVFTGFLYEELRASEDADIQSLLAHTDLLVDGPFLEGRRDTRRAFIGSENQRLYRLTDAYPEGIEYENPNHTMEIRIHGSTIEVNGWPFGSPIPC